VIEKNVLQITGQLPLSVQEDSSVVLKLTDLKVNDTESAYPTGFALTIEPGEHYTVNNQTIIPAADYFGNLTVGVTVRNAAAATPRFDLLVVVTPVNDLPYLANLETDPLFYNATKGTTLVTEEAIVTDVDDSQLLLAEIGFDATIYQPGSDFLQFETTANIRGIFDENVGILSLIGAASKEEYTTAIRSVQYWFASGDTLPTSMNKTIWFRLNDGKAQGQTQSRVVTLGENFILDIPNAFTPNDDLANDTWKIGASSESDALDYAVIRIYSKRGMLLYEAQGLKSEWDGRYNGEVLPADTYFYIIELNLPFTKSRHKGMVMILR
jgi:gliding motility-associated-like protein